MANYPHEADLQKIREWDVWRDLQGFVDFVTSLWEYNDYIRLSKGYAGEKIKNPRREMKEWEKRAWQYKIWRVSTAGWSGNEDIIGAMRDNFSFWHVCWHSTQKGGHFVFHLRRDLWDGTYARENPPKEEGIASVG